MVRPVMFLDRLLRRAPRPARVFGSGPLLAKRLVAVVVLLVSAGCAEQHDPGAAKPPPASPQEVARIRAALETYADLAHTVYADSSNRARELLGVVDDFLVAPSDARLARARAAWLAARVPYRQSEVFRFYDGPIDRVEMEVNTWPIDEGYVEAQPGSKVPGIIDDVGRYPELTLELLSRLNAKDGETSISTGYHVVEYLLWGADRRVDGPGDRPVSDYMGETGSVAARRGRYLRLAVENLSQNLERVRDAWAPGHRDNYRAWFLAQSPEFALALVLKGMGTLSGPELSGERMTVAYETKSQENEHSCFSDSTVDDLIGNGLGIVDVCKGEYFRGAERVVHGPGICDAVAARDEGLAARLSVEVQDSLGKLRAIPAPFDQSILGADSTKGRAAIWRAIRALEQQASTLGQVAARYDLRLARVANAEAP